MANLFKWFTGKIAGLFGLPTAEEEPRDRKLKWLDQGLWVNVQSSYVRAIRYSESDEVFSIRFKNGAVCRYPKTPKSLAEQMLKSTSKGKFTHHYFFGRPYF